MGKGVNKVILLGNLGNDPEMKYTQGGMAIANISLATTYSRKDKDGNREDKTEWHRVKFFGKLAEIAGEYLKKGSQCYVEGRLEYGSYEKDGVKHYTTDIIGEDMQLIGSRPQQDGNDSRERGRERTQQQRPAQQQQRPAPAQQQRPAPAQQLSDVPFDDDIPF